MPIFNAPRKRKHLCAWSVGKYAAMILLVAVSVAPTREKSAEMGKSAFERFKNLEGRWVGRSTKGWEEAVIFKTIARGSVVVETPLTRIPMKS